MPKIGEATGKRSPASSSQRLHLDALIVVDKIWNTEAEAETDDPDDAVKLYVLMPLKLTKKGSPEGNALATFLEKKRTANWKSIALTSPPEKPGIKEGYLWKTALNLWIY